MGTKTKTIKSDGFIIGISKSTVISSIFKIFFNYINNNITDPRGRTRWIHSAFPDNDLDTGKLDYPIVVIESPEPTWDKLTLLKKWSNISTRIEVYDTKAETAESIMQNVMMLFDTKWRELKSIKIDKVNISGFDQDSFLRGNALRVHMKAITIDCRYAWDRA